MNNSYLVAFADLTTPNTWIKRFEGRSIENIQTKIQQYVENNWEWEEDEKFPLDYNDFITYLKDNYDILIGEIQDIDTI
jgi:hypothetical protein